MNGSKFLDFFWGKTFLYLFIIFVIISLIKSFSLFSSEFGVRIDYTIIYPILIFLVMLSFLGMFFYFINRRMGIRLGSMIKAVRDQKEIAKSYGLKPKRAGGGLMYESDFLLDLDEEKIKFYPAVWCFDSNRRYSDPYVGRLSVMVTNKRIMVGAGPFSFYFPSKSPKDDKHYWFSDIEKTRYLFFIEGCLFFFHVPEKLAGPMRFLPTRRVAKRAKSGYIVDGLYLFPEDIDSFINVINKAQS